MFKVRRYSRKLVWSFFSKLVGQSKSSGVAWGGGRGQGGEGEASDEPLWQLQATKVSRNLQIRFMMHLLPSQQSTCDKCDRDNGIIKKSNAIFGRKNVPVISPTINQSTKKAGENEPHIII